MAARPLVLRRTNTGLETIIPRGGHGLSVLQSLRTAYDAATSIVAVVAMHRYTSVYVLLSGLSTLVLLQRWAFDPKIQLKIFQPHTQRSPQIGAGQEFRRGQLPANSNRSATSSHYRRFPGSGSLPDRGSSAHGCALDSFHILVNAEC
jgi:hypothetical protein